MAGSSLACALSGAYLGPIPSGQPGRVMAPPRTASSFAQLYAEIDGVDGAILADASLLGGLLIAAAGASGLTQVGTPVVRARPGGGVSAVIFLEIGHIAAHTVPDRSLIAVHAIMPRQDEAKRAIDVFARRFGATAHR